MVSQGIQAATRKRLALRFISGKYQGGEFPIEESSEIVVGRSSDLDMVLVEEMVSRKHARILLEGGVVTIEDLGSTNGTFVNGERITKAEIKEGDRVLIGSNILKVIASAEPVAPRASRAPVAAPPPPRMPPRKEANNDARMRGSLEEIPLPDLLQLFGTSRKTGVLVMRSGTSVGRIYLDKGVVTWVELQQRSAGGRTLDLAPLKGIYRMVSWDTGSFELEPPNTKVIEAPLDLSVQEVLMEGFRQRDEFEHMQSRLPSTSGRIALVTPLTARLRDLQPDQLDVLQAVLGASTVGDVIDRSVLPDLPTASALLALIERGYVAVSGA